MQLDCATSNRQVQTNTQLLAINALGPYGNDRDGCDGKKNYDKIQALSVYYLILSGPSATQIIFDKGTEISSVCEDFNRKRSHRLYGSFKRVTFLSTRLVFFLRLPRVTWQPPYQSVKIFKEALLKSSKLNTILLETAGKICQVTLMRCHRASNCTTDQIKY